MPLQTHQLIFNPMLRKLSTYWWCQLAGWGANMFISTFFYLTLSVRKVQNFFWIILISVLIGILISHLMRATIRYYRLLEKNIQTQILSFVGITILFSIFYACCDVGFEKLLNLRDPMLPKISLINEISRTAISNFFILFIWNLLYYLYHYIERNRKQQVDTLKLQSLVKELELKTIKAHINPHFIFNSLNSIRALVDENPQRARTAITELSNILRSSMQAEKMETVPLERELSIVRDYLALEKMRFEERLQVEMDIDEDTLQQPIPPMMLQTLVENAIKHGISKRMDGGTIRIISDFVDNHHEIVVLNSGKLNGWTSETGFGVSSTKDRLKLLYHDQASFTIQNVEPDLVESKVIMPVVI